MFSSNFALFHRQNKSFNGPASSTREGHAMNTLLYPQGIIYADAGASSTLARVSIDPWRATHSNGRIIERDLDRNPLPHQDAEPFGTFITPTERRTAGQQSIVGESDRQDDELHRADTTGLGLTHYKFGVPSTLEAHFDHIARAGIASRDTAEGRVGLPTGEEACVFAARGRIYNGAEMKPQHVRNYLDFLGIEQVRFAFATGLALGDETMARALAEARLAIDRLNSMAREAA